MNLLKRRVFSSLLFALTFAFCPVHVAAEESWGPRAGIDVPEIPRVYPDRMFLRRAWEPYTNYAYPENRYQNYPTILAPYRSPKQYYYGPLGDRLTHGIEGYRWEETQGLGRLSTGSSIQNISGNVFNYPGENETTYRRYFEDVLVVSEETSKWQGRLTIAQELMGRFTPLTLKVNAFPGFRIDVGSENTDLSALFMTYSSIRMGGLHLVQKLGLLNLGLTYINQHESFAESYGHAFSRKGVLRYNQPYPELLAVKFSDDSPEDDRGGPYIAEVNIYVNGVLRKDIQPDIVGHLNGVNETSVGVYTAQGLVRNPYAAVTSAGGASIPTGTTYFDYRIREGPLYMDYLFFKDLRLNDPVDPERRYTKYVWKGVEFPIEEKWHLAVTLEPDKYKNKNDYKEHADEILAAHFSEEQVRAILMRNNALNNTYRPLEQSFTWLTGESGPIQAAGDDYVVYYFDLSQAGYVRSVSFDALVANDYKIEVATVDRQVEVDVSDPYAPLEVPYTKRYNSPTLYRVVARAPGNIQDKSNLKRISFDMGTQTGMEIFGANFSTDIFGLKLDGEFARSTHYYQYPDGVVGSAVYTPGAYAKPVAAGTFPNAERQGTRFRSVGDAYYLVARKDYERLGWGVEYFHMGPKYDTELKLLGTPITQRYNRTLRLMMVDDNDDDDRFPDSWFTAYIAGFVNEGIDTDGIFPGKDEDGDGRPDTNKNGNRTPDYLEPFLMYNVESDDYVYDLDMNHNDRPDSREDDPEPDYPYPEDLEGYHALGTYQLRKGLGLSLGRVDAHQQAGGGKNLVNYGRLSVKAKRPGVGKLFLENTLERVWDSVPDRVLVSSDFTRGLFGKFHAAGFGYQQQYDLNLVKDNLRYRNSWSNRFYLEGNLTPVKGLRMYHNLRYELNHQQPGALDDGTYQRKNQIRLLSSVHRLDYTWRRPRSKFELIPAVKLLFLKRTQDITPVPLANEMSIIPILKANYYVTPRTVLRAGAQGLPGFEYRVRDYANDWNSFRQHVYVFMMSNVSDYFGYKIVASAGLSFDYRTFDSPFRSAENDDIMTTFVQIVAGVPEP